MLEIRGLVKRYGAATVLDGVDLHVEEHEVVTLIGASGSGKSTLLRCVDLLEEIDDGQILLDGVDVSDPRAGQDAAAAQRRMAIVFQAFNLFPHLTAAQNVALAPRVVHRLPAAEADDRARELLDRVGLAAFGGAYPDRLSGGQQQRVAIARALAVRPRLLLLDEITSALDPELVGEVLAIVRELAEGGMTILMATHEMGFARQVSDRVCFLDGGRVLESGPPEQVLGEPVEARTRAVPRPGDRGGADGVSEVLDTVIAMRRLLAALPAVLLLLAGCASTPPPPPPPPPTPAAPATPTLESTAGEWAGRIGIPGAPLDIGIRLTAEGGGLRGEIDIPAQAIKAHAARRRAARGP